MSPFELLLHFSHVYFWSGQFSQDEHFLVIIIIDYLYRILSVCYTLQKREYAKQRT